ncbi:methyl-accepting chemotaxis protein [Limisalsivibrio acetivorans]|uniref:methyl-accepting chemotaxis protein n=1 Tax=Limisalsivibrio acetivorans TaxID=1304888 RepID=UPI0003B48FEB|nr:methyl-accepting chemotaxis protein [Limisalsivibrio acetivorans]
MFHSISKKIFIFNVIIGGIFVIIALTTLFYVKQQKTDEALLRYETKMTEDIQNLLEKKYDVGITNAVGFSANPNIVSSLATGMREIGINTLMSIGEMYKSNTNYKGIKIHIHDKNGHSFIRNWNTVKYGDDLTKSRTSIKNIINNKKTIVQFEAGRIGIMIRAIAPVMSDGEYIGSIEFLQGVGSVSRDLEKKGIMYALIATPDIAAKSTKIASNKTIGNYHIANNKWFSENVLGSFKSISPDDLIKRGKLLTKEYFFISIPVKDISTGNTLGYHMVGTPSKIVMDEINANMKLPYILIGLLIATVVVIVIVLNSYIKITVVSKIKTIQEKMAVISNGDFTTKIPVSGRDEICDLGQAVNYMTKDLSCSFFNIDKRVQHLITLSNNLGSLSERISAGAVQQKETSTSAASAIEELNATVQEVASNASLVAEAAVSAEKMVTEGHSLSVKAKEGMLLITDNVTQSKNSVVKLDELSNEIGQIIQVINDIADQTNLLALNAAIEAARAGDHGRGFAVVADEVRKLADKTTEATKNIAGMIVTIQQETRTTVSNMQSSAERVEEGMETSEKTRVALEEILNSVKTVTQEVEKIAQATDEEAKAMDLLNQSMLEIDSIAKENHNIADETVNMISDLDVVNKEITNSVAAFKYDKN